MTDWGIDFDVPTGIVVEEAGRERDRVLNIIAYEAARKLRLIGTNIWPRDTTFSARRFVVEEEAGIIAVYNTAPYARFVNNIRTFRNGRQNRNYHAAQRQVRKFWNSILAKAAA